MKIKTIIGIGLTGLLCSIAGGYYYWATMQVLVLFAGSQGDNTSLNRSAWLSLLAFSIGIALLVTSGIAFFISRRRKHGLSAA